MYGGLAAIRACAGHTDFLHQTYAWSGGQWDASAVLHQYLNGQHVAGVTADLDRSLAASFGQWSATSENSDMPLLIAVTPDPANPVAHNPGTWLLSGALYVHVDNPTTLSGLGKAGVPTATVDYQEHLLLVAASTTPGGAAPGGAAATGKVSGTGTITLTVA